MLRGWRIGYVLAMGLLPVLLPGCGQLPEDLSADGPTPEKSVIEADQGALIRMELARLHGELPTVGYEDLLEAGHVVERGVTSGSQRLDSRIRKLFFATADYRIDQVGDAEVKVQRIKLNNDFPPLKIIGRYANTVLPFRMRANAEIEFARLLSAESADRAHTFTLLDIPFDAASALRLPEQTIVTIPIEANVSFDVGGSFLAQSAAKSAELWSQLSASAYETTSSVRHGSIIASGQFRMQVIRGRGEQVRLRLMSASEYGINAGVSSSAGAGARYAFLPAAKLDRIRALKRRIDRIHRLGRGIFDAHDNITHLREQAPQAIKGVFDTTPWVSEKLRPEWEEQARSAVDSALQTAQNLTTPIEVLEKQIGQRVQSYLDSVDGVWDGRVEPVTERLQELSSRVYSLNYSVTLSDQLSRELRLMADYEFDLSNADAGVAFDRALSGRTVWRGAVKGLVDWNVDEMAFADFTLADVLASDDQGMENPRVVRLASGGSDRRERKYTVSLSGLGVSVGLDGNFRDNRVILRDRNGVEREWLNRAWERGHRSRFFGVARAESFASGAFTASEDNELSSGGYWFRWKKEYGLRAQQPVADVFLHAVNDLGPLAVRAGLEDRYRGEYFGTVHGDLFVMLTDEALNALFDPERTTERVLWETLTEMMDRYERPVSLPYAHAPIRPREAREKQFVGDGCEAVAERIGGRYCYSFIDRIFPALFAAQASGSAEDRLAFFESFYRVPAGGGSLSTRFLVRYLSEIMFAIGQTEGVNFELKVTNLDDDSDAASPLVRVGEEAALALGEATLLEGLVAH